MKHWKYAVIAFGAVAAITTVGACTSNSGSGSAGDIAAPPRAAVPAAQASSAAGGAAGSAGSRSDATAGDADLAAGPSKIRIVELSVTVKHGKSVAAQADSAETVATAAGGEVDADDRSAGRYASATLVLKVPPEQLATVLTTLSKLGIETSRRQTTTDVSARVADVTSRVTSARVAIARLRGLYAHTTKVADVIAVETELSQRESDLESLEAQQRGLSAQTSMATVTLRLSTQVVKPPVKTKAHHHSGFLGGLQSGWDAFTGGTVAVATAVGAVLPFAVLALVLLVATRLLWPRLRPAAATTAGPAATSPTE